jgi:hypothetical protein
MTIIPGNKKGICHLNPAVKNERQNLSETEFALSNRKKTG